jgi:transcription termination factor Rho
MTEPTETQPAALEEEQKKPTRRRAPRAATRAKPRRTRSKSSTETGASELPLNNGTEVLAAEPAAAAAPSDKAEDNSVSSDTAEVKNSQPNEKEALTAQTAPEQVFAPISETPTAPAFAPAAEVETLSGEPAVPDMQTIAGPANAQPNEASAATTAVTQTEAPAQSRPPLVLPPARERERAETPAQPQPHPEPPRYEPQFADGIVEVSGKGFGFLRDAKRNFTQSPQDVFVTPEVVRRFNLRDGQWIKGEVRRGSRGFQLFRLTEVNGEDPNKCINLPVFEELTVVSPLERIQLETVPERYTTRIMDMMTPIGKGQRGLIVAPPRTGKTTLLQHIADAVVKNHPETHLIILLVDERPEEVTEIRRAVPSAEMMASSNDMDIKSHTRIAQLAIERAKRLVEAGKDVFVLLDSITRVGRAFNNAMGGGGRTMSGGIDARALEIPRKLFAAARNTEEAGSLTIIATALIETGSRMDELIFQEFKGTGNMELVLDRKVSDLRIYPAIDIFKSGTRRDELLIPADQLHKINVIRRGLAGHKPEEAIERLLSFVRKFPTNTQMLREIPG